MRPEDLIAIDRAHVWRPYTSHDDHAGRDLLVVRGAEGPWLIDEQGRRVFDGSGSWWCNNLGHQNPRIVAALTEQARSLLHCTFAGVAHEQATLLAKELVDVAPTPIARAFFSDNGSTAVEVGLKMAFQFWQQNGGPNKKKFIALPGAYHGDTFGAMSVSGVDAFNDVFSPLRFEVVHAPEPEGTDWGATFDAINVLLKTEPDSIAAVVVEPLVQGAAGMRMYDPKFLAALREATVAADTFLIADEVFTGFGRTGTMWASDQANVCPDIMCVAKGLSGGALPFSATLTTERVYDGFSGDKARALMHGHTFCGNPLGARVAREVLAIYRDEQIIERSQPLGEALSRGIDNIGAIDGVHGARSLGMVAACDVGPTGYHGLIGWEIYEAALQRGAHIRPLGNTVYLIPPLTITQTELSDLLSITHDAIEAVLKKGIR